MTTPQLSITLRTYSADDPGTWQPLVVEVWPPATGDYDVEVIDLDGLWET